MNQNNAEIDQRALFIDQKQANTILSEKEVLILKI